MNQSDPNPAVFGAIIAGAIAFVLLIGLVINAVICWLISSALQRIPEGHRKISPGQVWLLMIPCFSFVWNFIVFQRVPESFQSHFNSVGRNDLGDCGKQLGLWFSIASVGSMIPVLQYVAGPAALVLMILCLVKFHDLKNRI